MSKISCANSIFDVAMASPRMRSRPPPSAFFKQHCRDNVIMIVLDNTPTKTVINIKLLDNTVQKCQEAFPVFSFVNGRETVTILP